MSFALVGKVWDEESFEDYVRTLDLSWARGITMHHTASPSLAQRPMGFTIQHIRNIAHFYRNKLKWSRGPHLFIDDDQIFGMSPLTERGVHARSFNSRYIGIEVLGNYDVESPTSGRGLSCWITAVMAVAILQRCHPHLKEINGHRDDVRSSKTCPGKLVNLDVFRSDVASLLAETSDRNHDDTPLPAVDLAAIKRCEDAIASARWQLNKAEKELASLTP